MSTITIKIDTDHLDRQAVADIADMLYRSVAPARAEATGWAWPIYPMAIVTGETLMGDADGTVARFQLDKNKPKL